MRREDQYQSEPRRRRLRLCVLHDVTTLPPFINERELKEFRGNAPKCRNAWVIKLFPYWHESPQGLQSEFRERNLVCIQCAPPLPPLNFELDRREML